MKKLISMLAALMLVLASTASAYTGTTLEAPKANGVEIDGDLSDWDTSKMLRIEAEPQITDQIEHWDGVEDCAMEVSAMWDEENLYFAISIWDKDPFVYREGFPLDELDAIILFFSTDMNADADRTEYTATDWRLVLSADKYKTSYDYFFFADRSMIADPMGWETQGEDGDLLIEDILGDYESAIAVTDFGYTWEIRIPLSELANDDIAQMIPEAGKSIGFEFSILDVDLPCPGIHSLRMEYSADLNGKDRNPGMYNVDENPSLWATITFAD